MFGQAGHTEYDVRFQLFGIPIRIHPIFWISSAYIVWDRDEPARVFIGILCLMVSVLVHEIGHAAMCRRYGFPSEIVLYVLGGYATASRFSTWKNVKVSAAGPAAGFVLFGLTYAVFRYLLDNHPEMVGSSHIVGYCIFWMLFMNLMWSIINLIPCMPLDGGRIVEVLVRRYRPRGSELRLQKVYILASGGVALWSLFCIKNGEMDLIPIPSALLPGLNVSAIQPHPTMMAIMFGVLCAHHVMKFNQMQQHM